MGLAQPGFICLMVLDGWGLAPAGPGNAVTSANTPNLDRLFRDYPSTVLRASGEAVGLPPGQMGNSEVGHLNLGAGRVVYQELTRINRAIKDGSFFSNPELIRAFTEAKERGGSVHLMGLLSDGGVHSDLEHLKALVRLSKQQGVDRLYLDMFLDGRDVPPRSGAGYVSQIDAYLKAEGIGCIATISGRYYAMDRDHRWDRVKLAYDAIVHGKGPHNTDPESTVHESYEQGITDEFVIPTVICQDESARLKTTDSAIFFNFRPDRARQLTQALTFADFDAFDRGGGPPLPYLVCMTQYDATYPNPVAFPPERRANVLAKVLSDAGKTQLHIAETEKYAHVTFFFNGGREKVYPGEERRLIPSPVDVPTYDLKPEMSAREVTDELLKQLDSRRFDFIAVNYANCDMVGHTGRLEAAVKAVETVDQCVGRVADRVLEQGGICLITADHGNAERMIDDDNGPDTAHTTDDVPLIVTDPGANLAPGCGLGDIAAVILEYLRIPVPDEMTGRCLSGRLSG